MLFTIAILASASAAAYNTAKKKLRKFFEDTSGDEVNVAIEPIILDMKDDYFHFTNKANVNSILNNGLWPKKHLERKGVKFADPIEYSEKSRGFDEMKYSNLREYNHNFARFAKFTAKTYSFWSHEDWFDGGVIFVLNTKETQSASKSKRPNLDEYRSRGMLITKKNIKRIIFQMDYARKETNKEELQRIEDKLGVEVVVIERGLAQGLLVEGQLKVIGDINETN